MSEEKKLKIKVVRPFALNGGVAKKNSFITVEEVFAREMIHANKAILAGEEKKDDEKK